MIIVVGGAVSLGPATQRAMAQPEIPHSAAGVPIIQGERQMKLKKKKRWKATDVPLGAMARDRISGFEGIIECRSEWLNGCIRITLAPNHLDKDGNIIGNRTFDIEQVKVLDDGLVVVEATLPERNGPTDDPVRGH